MQVYKGPQAKGEEVANGKAKVSGGNWSMSPLASALKDGKYTAIASQPSSLKNPTGTSAQVTFTVDTAPPKVTLNPIPSPTSDAAPTFGGDATDPKEKGLSASTPGYCDRTGCGLRRREYSRKHGPRRRRRLPLGTANTRP